MATFDTPPGAETPDPASGIERAAPTAAWLLYTLIVLEILFMVSPLAAYYYAVYGLPLNALADAPATAWLALHILPHFSHSDSALVIGLIAASWPLILLGLGAFAVGFVQIYRARFGRRGAVLGGAYRYVRHPQYLALALVGLGTTLFWSRFVVLLAFVMMLCLYGGLARLEERQCLLRYGHAYRDYMARTGRFLPRRLEAALRSFLPRLPDGTRARRAVRTVAVAGIAASAIGGGWWLRGHTIASLQVTQRDSHAILFLAPMPAAYRDRVATLMADRLGNESRLAYVAPAHWSVPELGLMPPAGHGNDGARELVHPTSHGNAGGYDRGIRVLVTRPQTHRPADGGRDLLAATARIAPLFTVSLDPTATSIGSREPAAPSAWGEIPVPVY